MTNASPGPALLALWQRLEPRPGGRWLFGRLLARRVPYSGSIGARVVHLRPGDALLAMRDRPGLRNHLGSIHAVALANLGELTSGLAMLTALPLGVRGIVLRLDSRYHRKARGDVQAHCRCEVPAVTDAIDVVVAAQIHDADGRLVAEVRATWRLDRRPPQA